MIKSIIHSLKENTSKIYFNNSTWKTNLGDNVVIVGKTKSNKYLCKFEDGTTVEFLGSNITNGEIKNPNKPSICNVGYIGQGIWKPYIDGVITREYSLWHNTINRCYNENNLKRNPTYRGVKICSEWKNLQNFCYDIQELEGYEEWLQCEDKDKYHLDKDILCDILNITPKIYSKLTCKFITKSENSIYTNLTGELYFGERLSDGYIETFSNQTEFSKKYSLSRSIINMCIHEKQNQHRGWKFYKK